MTAQPGRRCLPSVRTPAERNVLVEANLHLAYWCVSPYLDRNREHIDDLRQAALLGLMRAGDLWDASRGCKFSTYAVMHIRQAIQGCLITQPLVRTPDSRRARRPPEKSVRSLEDWEAEHLRERQHIEPSGELLEVLERCISKLKPRHQECIRGVLLRGQTLTETGKRLGISKEAVRVNIRVALKRLADMVPASLLD